MGQPSDLEQMGQQRISRPKREFLKRRRQRRTRLGLQRQTPRKHHGGYPPERPAMAAAISGQDYGRADPSWPDDKRRHTGGNRKLRPCSATTDRTAPARRNWRVTKDRGCFVDPFPLIATLRS